MGIDVAQIQSESYAKAALIIQIRAVLSQILSDSIKIVALATTIKLATNAIALHLAKTLSQRKNRA